MGRGLALSLSLLSFAVVALSGCSPSEAPSEPDSVSSGSAQTSSGAPSPEGSAAPSVEKHTGRGQINPNAQMPEAGSKAR